MSLYDMAKDAFKLAQSSDNIELIQKILDVQQQALAQQEEVIRLRTENSALRAQLDDAGTVEHFYGLYWKRLPDKSLDGPFSQARWDQDRKLVRLTYSSTGDYGDGNVHKFHCSAAKYTYAIPLSFYDRERVKNAEELRKPAPEGRPPTDERKGFMDGYDR
jgi:hypothetical protein